MGTTAELLLRTEASIRLVELSDTNRRHQENQTSESRGECVTIPKNSNHGVQSRPRSQICRKQPDTHKEQLVRYGLF